ncbi:Peptide methionine sulfoxide reductase MsrA / Peptide methionine sulfoxide reductase MsrB [Anaerovibrio sp. JC8]|uniref:peptide-methionine (S)-S-oxide reductase n=1 Tax=Anaerovibrio sp. JC8 TaxID=1240085 RepID=UPI000A0E3FE2|nr:peptide-methionine (S)-S-oxide reductase [Anaerovibrio sp. JC8]ORU01374.1 Peptide methionine sulfoxide reductase MsrA / Peptide methionine sulfoxide reductase MsrB [Anaerovibrio sp. JC8]
MYTKKIYFSGGSFHELQAVFEILTGVISVKAGYINPESQPVSYEAVEQGHVKAVMGICAEYNPKKIDVSSLLDILFSVTDPYSEHGQGNLIGPMFMCGVYNNTPEDLPQIQLHLNFMANKKNPPAVAGSNLTINDPVSDQKQRRKLCVRSEELHVFVEAEEEHQDYLKKNPTAPTYVDIQKFKNYISK